MKINKVIIFGKLPPPVGGVTKSIQSLFNAFKSKDISVDFFNPKSILKKYDIAHINYIKRWKIIAAIIIGNFIANKTILTYHSLDFYPQDSYIDRMILKYLDGLIVLNETVKNRCLNISNNKTKIRLFTPILKEGINNSDDLIKNTFFEKNKFKKYMLLYAFDKVYKENKEVYGIKFILDLMDELDDEYVLILVDPKSGYKKDIDDLNLKERVIYINEIINFDNLLYHIDVYIRPTNFDGNSVATLEALSKNKFVIASDCVERQKGIITYINNNIDDFIEKLNSLKNLKTKQNIELTTVSEFIDFCNEI